MVTIIVPVYNSSEYLSRCVDSILKQTYSDIELLLVDDCSTDNSFEVMQKYAKKDSRVRCFQTPKNSGPSTARNIGLDNAKGEWISFVDSDDWLEEQYIERLLTVVNNDGSDMAICGLVNQYEKTEMYEKSFSESVRIIDKENLSDLRMIILQMKTETGNSGLEITGPVCKLYRREMIGEKRFPIDVVLGEDTCFVMECIDSCIRITYIGECLYRRVVRNDSLSYGTKMDYGKRRADYVNKMIAYLIDKEYPQDIINQFVYLNYKQVVNYYVPLDYRKRNKKWKEYIEEFLCTIDWKIVFSRADDIRLLKDMLTKKRYIVYKIMFNICLKMGRGK